MPNGIYPPSINHRIREDRSRSSHPGAGLRLRTWWRRDRLDEQLARGTDPRISAELELRGEQLDNAAERDRLADALEGVVREATQPAAFLSLMVRRPEVRACADELLALANRLRDDHRIDLRGAAMTTLLLTNGQSPLYAERASLPLRDAVRSARLALDDEVDQASQSAFPTAA